MFRAQREIPSRQFPGLRQAIWPFLKDLYAETQEDRVFTGAAALSYYLLFALFPGLIFLLTLMPYLPVENLQQTVMEFFRQMLPGDTAKTVQGVVLEITTQKRSGLLSIGFLLALWSASSGLAAVMEELNVTYDVKETRAFWRTRCIALGLTVAFSVLMIASCALIVFGTMLQNWLSAKYVLPEEMGAVFGAFRWIVTCFLSLTAFSLMYYFGPDVRQRFKFITPGSIIGTLLLGLSSLAFRLYIQDFANYTASYGSLGAVIVLMLWLYVAGVVIMLGSEINALIEHYSRTGKEKGQKAPGDQIGQNSPEKRAADQDSELAGKLVGHGAQTSQG